MRRLIRFGANFGAQNSTFLVFRSHAQKISANINWSGGGMMKHLLCTLFSLGGGGRWNAEGNLLLVRNNSRRMRKILSPVSEKCRLCANHLSLFSFVHGNRGGGKELEKKLINKLYFPIIRKGFSREKRCNYFSCLEILVYSKARLDKEPCVRHPLIPLKSRKWFRFSTNRLRHIIRRCKAIQKSSALRNLCWNYSKSNSRTN